MIRSEVNVNKGELRHTFWENRNKTRAINWGERQRELGKLNILQKSCCTKKKMEKKKLFASAPDRVPPGEDLKDQLGDYDLMQFENQIGHSPNEWAEVNFHGPNPMKSNDWKIFRGRQRTRYGKSRWHRSEGTLQEKFEFVTRNGNSV